MGEWSDFITPNKWFGKLDFIWQLAPRVGDVWANSGFTRDCIGTVCRFTHKWPQLRKIGQEIDRIFRSVTVTSTLGPGIPLAVNEFW
jgi:hypothetical protein